MWSSTVYKALTHTHGPFPLSAFSLSLWWACLGVMVARAKNWQLLSGCRYLYHPAHHSRCSALAATTIHIDQYHYAHISLLQSQHQSTLTYTRRSGVVMNECSTRHSAKVESAFVAALPYESQNNPIPAHHITNRTYPGLGMVPPGYAWRTIVCVVNAKPPISYDTDTLVTVIKEGQATASTSSRNRAPALNND